MAVIGLQPIMLKDATFTVAADDYTASITQALFVPQVEWGWAERMATPPVPYFIRARWVCQLGYVQDLSTPDALSRYLIAHAAQVRTIILTPKAGGSTVTADVMIVPGPIGGVPNQQLTATVVLPLFEEPTLGTVV